MNRVNQKRRGKGKRGEGNAWLSLPRSGILACFCFVLQRYGEEAPSYQKQDFWH
jgi:hypothetical protein